MKSKGLVNYSAEGFRQHRTSCEGDASAWRGKLSLTPTTFTRPTPIQLVQVSCSVDQISWDRAPPQLHHHNGPVCKCENLMSHHKNSVSPSWSLEQYLFSCSQRAAPQHPGTVFPNEAAQCCSWNKMWRPEFYTFFFPKSMSIKKLSQSYSLAWDT